MIGPTQYPANQILQGRSTPLLSVQILLALVFAISFCTKATNVRSFVVTVKAYGILGNRFSKLYAWTVVPLEGLISISHFTGYLLVVAVPVAILLLLTFILATSTAYLKKLEIPCHCFGKDEEISLRILGRGSLILVADGRGICEGASKRCGALACVRHSLVDSRVERPQCD